MLKKSLQTLTLIPLSVLSILGSSDNLSLEPRQQVIAQRQISLENRHPDQFVNGVFRKNILLNLAYLNGEVSSPKDIKWEEIIKPFSFEFRLDPNQTFAFHEDVLEKYQATLVKTTNAHFNAAEGFITDGYLFGDGVCHLASLLYWVAKDAGLLAEAPTNHDFMAIPDIPKEYGVSIYSNLFSKGSNAQQNLYITNNKSKPLSFKFEYLEDKLRVSLVE